MKKADLASLHEAPGGGIMSEGWEEEKMQLYGSVAITPLRGLLYWENKQYPHTTN